MPKEVVALMQSARYDVWEHNQLCVQALHKVTVPFPVRRPARLTNPLTRPKAVSSHSRCVLGALAERGAVPVRLGGRWQLQPAPPQTPPTTSPSPDADRYGIDCGAKARHLVCSNQKKVGEARAAGA